VEPPGRPVQRGGGRRSPRRQGRRAAPREGLFKRCPGRRSDGSPCGECIQHPRGHVCHLIKPGTGCATCRKHFCYACLGPYVYCGKGFGLGGGGRGRGRRFDCSFNCGCFDGDRFRRCDDDSSMCCKCDAILGNFD